MWLNQHSNWCWTHNQVRSRLCSEFGLKLTGSTTFSWILLFTIHFICIYLQLATSCTSVNPPNEAFLLTQCTLCVNTVKNGCIDVESSVPLKAFILKWYLKWYFMRHGLQLKWQWVGGCGKARLELGFSSVVSPQSLLTCCFILESEMLINFFDFCYFPTTSSQQILLLIFRIASHYKIR